MLKCCGKLLGNYRIIDTDDLVIEDVSALNALLALKNGCLVEHLSFSMNNIILEDSCSDVWYDVWGRIVSERARALIRGDESVFWTKLYDFFEQYAEKAGDKFFYNAEDIRNYCNVRYKMFESGNFLVQFMSQVEVKNGKILNYAYHVTRNGVYYIDFRYKDIILGSDQLFDFENAEESNDTLRITVFAINERFPKIDFSFVVLRQGKVIRLEV